MVRVRYLTQKLKSELSVKYLLCQVFAQIFKNFTHSVLNESIYRKEYLTKGGNKVVQARIEFGNTSVEKNP